MRFVRIEPGSFVIGADVRILMMHVASNKLCLNRDYDEFPRHRVTIACPFYVGIFEVTNQQYEQFDPERRTLRGKLSFSRGRRPGGDLRRVARCGCLR